MIRMSAIPRDVKAHIALCGRWKATQCDFDAKYRWCGNAGTQVAIRRIAADDRPSRFATAPGHCQAIPAASAVQYRRDTPKCG
ncbi:hypothetical protein BIFBIF_01344 [Bifidobacterium bifidum ATCC 29521 = JCM 1255 = DSM 20456]|nr:hypothetical protein BIFBIF_01344 [Bifidobacterium bifidum ATCC 29521 = JCM 1255 = DSM 20456]